MSANSLMKIIEKEGILIPIEFNNLPFDPKRVFLVYGVPKGEKRGNHAHYETEQILICVQGKLNVFLFDGKDTKIHTLFPGEQVYVGKMIWDAQIYEEENTIMLSICSTHYDSKDYINDIEVFKELCKKN